MARYTEPDVLRTRKRERERVREQLGDRKFEIFAIDKPFVKRGRGKEKGKEGKSKKKKEDKGSVRGVDG